MQFYVAKFIEECAKSNDCFDEICGTFSRLGWNDSCAHWLLLGYKNALGMMFCRLYQIRKSQ